MDDSVYLKRRLEAIEYFNHIPVRKVDLQEYVKLDEDNITWNYLEYNEIRKKHLSANGLDALQCGTLACVAGWLLTMPAYQEWAQRQQYDTDGNFMTLLTKFLGLPLYKNKDENDTTAYLKFFSHRWESPYDQKHCYDIEYVTDHTLAVNRLQHLVSQPIVNYEG